MKYLAFILGIYTFYLVTVPCVDEVFHAGAQASSLSSPQNQNESHKPCEACSPFCVCSCCSVTVTLATFHFEIIPLFPIRELQVPFTRWIASNFFHAIWQPPKLS